MKSKFEAAAAAKRVALDLAATFQEQWIFMPFHKSI